MDLRHRSPAGGPGEKKAPRKDRAWGSSESFPRPPEEHQRRLSPGKVLSKQREALTLGRQERAWVYPLGPGQASLSQWGPGCPGSWPCFSAPTSGLLPWLCPLTFLDFLLPAGLHIHPSVAAWPLTSYTSPPLEVMMAWGWHPLAAGRASQACRQLSQPEG